MAIHGRGRPTLLTEVEEKIVFESVRYLRQKGSTVDREVLQVLGKRAMSEVRSLPLGRLPDLSDHWAKSFRKRYSLTKLRKPTTDRGISSAAQLQADEQWRQAYLEVVRNPGRFGIIVPADGPHQLPEYMQLAADETPLQYCPVVRGTYQEGDLSKQVTIIAAREKRSVTGTPVVSRDGSLLTFQVIWKGKTRQCHPKPLGGWDRRIFHDHAAKKVQTGFTFKRLLCEIEKALVSRRAQHGLPQNYPAVVIMDNAPSHDTSSLQSAPPPFKTCEHLFRAADHPGLWVWFTLKNRSHTQNPGDQHINLSLRRLCRRQSKLRIVQHFLRMKEGTFCTK